MKYSIALFLAATASQTNAFVSTTNRLLEPSSCTNSRFSSQSLYYKNTQGDDEDYTVARKFKLPGKQDTQKENLSMGLQSLKQQMAKVQKQARNQESELKKARKQSKKAKFTVAGKDLNEKHGLDSLLNLLDSRDQELLQFKQEASSIRQQLMDVQKEARNSIREREQESRKFEKDLLHRAALDKKSLKKQLWETQTQLGNAKLRIATAEKVAEANLNKAQQIYQEKMDNLELKHSHEIGEMKKVVEAKQNAIDRTKKRFNHVISLYKEKISSLKKQIQTNEEVLVETKQQHEEEVNALLQNFDEERDYMRSQRQIELENIEARHAHEMDAMKLELKLKKNEILHNEDRAMNKLMELKANHILELEREEAISAEKEREFNEEKRRLLSVIAQKNRIIDRYELEKSTYKGIAMNAVVLTKSKVNTTKDKVSSTVSSTKDKVTSTKDKIYKGLENANILKRRKKVQMIRLQEEEDNE